MEKHTFYTGAGNVIEIIIIATLTVKSKQQMPARYCEHMKSFNGE